MLVDLAHATAGDRDTALDNARHLAAQIKSDRQQRRLAALVLPPVTAVPRDAT
jgi:hypothetical protein